jgi:predicted PhzF superfamily epimerase YddE/YHI9
VRYFSPESEVSFCGHATIATAVAYAERHQADELRFDTPAGRVDVHVADSGDGPLATLTSVPPHVDNAPDEDVAEALAALGRQPQSRAFLGRSRLQGGTAPRQALRFAPGSTGFGTAESWSQPAAN